MAYRTKKSLNLKQQIKVLNTLKRYRAQIERGNLNQKQMTNILLAQGIDMSLYMLCTFTQKNTTIKWPQGGASKTGNTVKTKRGPNSKTQKLLVHAVTHLYKELDIEVPKGLQEAAFGR